MIPPAPAISVLPEIHPSASSHLVRAYDFHGLRLTVAAGPEALAALVARLEEFPVAGLASSPHLHFDFHPFAEEGSRHVQRPLGAGRIVMDLTAGAVEYFEASQQLYVDLGVRGRALAGLRTRRVEVAYPGPDAKSIWLCSHPLFTIPLAELLKREGLYMVHAGGLAHAGRGLLVAGASGAGKTTLTLALLRAGFGFLADDTVFLAQTSKTSPGGDRAQIRVLAFPDEVDLTEQTAGFFPELRLKPGECRPEGRPKRAVCATRLYGVAPEWECDPAVLLFPKTAPADESVLSDMSKDEALLQLLCNVVRTDADASQAHLNALAMLVQQCDCYRLQTGRDFEALPGLLRPLLVGHPARVRP